MAATSPPSSSIWCCLRWAACCGEGGAGGHIRLKEMPAVQLDTRRMGKERAAAGGRPARPSWGWGKERPFGHSHQLLVEKYVPRRFASGVQPHALSLRTPL